MSQPSPLLAARQHAVALAESGDLDGALALLEHSVAVGNANLGEDDPEVLATAHQLAAVHRQGDDLSAARRVLEEAYAAGQWRLGDADPLILEISYDIGTIAEELGNRHEARKAFARVATNGPAVLGADHWAVTHARSYLGDDPAAFPAQPAATEAQRAETTATEARLAETTATESRPAETTASETTASETTAADARSAETITAETWPAETRPADTVRLEPVRSEPVRTELSQSRVQAAPPTSAPERQAAPAHHQQGPAHDQGTTYQQAPTHQQVSADQQIPIPQQVPAYEQPTYPQAPAPWPSEPGVQHITPAGSVSHSTLDAPYGKKGPALFAALTAVLAAMIAVAALVFVLTRRDGDAGDQNSGDVPTLSGAAPADVLLRDHGGFVQLSWTDPAAGKTSFLVTGGRPGELLRPLGQVGPGQTTYTLQGLNAKLDYCFAVVAVYSTNTFASSPPACTSRVSRPAPSASR